MKEAWKLVGDHKDFAVLWKRIKGKWAGVIGCNKNVGKGKKTDGRKKHFTTRGTR